MPDISPLGHERSLSFYEVNFNTYLFLRDKLPMQKRVWTAVRTMVEDRKNQKALALLYLASKPLRKAVKSSGLLTEFTTELTRQI